MNKILQSIVAACLASCTWGAEELLLENWAFRRGASDGAEAAAFDDKGWERVRIPHDWAITGPFDKNIDKQVVRIEQDGETAATEKTGRSGALPWIGEGWYRRALTIPEGTEHAELVFDGAMSEPVVYVDGVEVGRWAYGYNSFSVDISSLKPGAHMLAVHLKNVKESSRWYPGAGLYRPVRLVTAPKDGFVTWGTFVRTTAFKDDVARVTVTDEWRGRFGKGAEMRWTVHDAAGTIVAQGKANAESRHEATGVLQVKSPDLWSPESPTLYTLTSELVANKKTIDTRTTTFGIRTISYSDQGFKLNGVRREFQGVCLHHDLGPLGAAFNKAAFRRQVRLLKDMGCDAIRTAHNMPAPWQMEICDEMGMLVMAESFDMWVSPKCKNGYNRFYKDWWKRDLTNLIRAHRNHPSIVMWSIGNEVSEQFMEQGLTMTRDMQNFCHSLDATRPVTQGFHKPDGAVKSGVLQAMDVAGLNYRLDKYHHAYAYAPHGFILGTETASTTSSRGVYKFPVKERKMRTAPYDDGQCSSYDVESTPWANLPDLDRAIQEDNDWTIGEFVWTGFDYLGEPSPYNEYWPSRSSYFGIFDLAGLPKDRMWWYRAQWNKTDTTLHVLPHWTWPGREGEVTPVYVYTSYPSAELFVNDVSQGKRTFDKSSHLDRYRLRWNDVIYQPGELKVIAYDKDGNAAAEEVVRTAGEPKRLVLEADRSALAALAKDDSPDLAFVTVTVVDEKGTPCPDAALQLSFAAEGSVAFKAVCNGDATSLEVFTEPTMKTFHGKLVVVVSATEKSGDGRLTVTAPGLASATLDLSVE